MDPANEHKIKTTIEHLRDRGTYIHVIQEVLSDTKEDVESIKKDLSDTKQDVESIKKDFSDTEEDFKCIQKDFSDTKESVKSINKYFSDTQEDVKSIKKDLGDTKESVRSIKKDFSDKVKMATAAPITTYSDREFLFRLQTLVIDGGTEVLRNIFDQRLQNQPPLNVVLTSERSTINRLRRQNILTRAQYEKLYPSSGQLPTSSDFDFTLIVCLLRHIPSIGCNQNYNWNVPPQTGDTSVEADVCRLRGFRNEIVHEAPTTGFKQSSFEAKWREIETVLLRLDQNSPTPNFRQTIVSYKYGPMDSANEHKIKTTIEHWQKKGRGLETDMQLIKEDLSDTKEDVESIKKDLSDTKEDVKCIQKDFSDTKESVKSIKKDISDTKESVKSINKDFSNTQEDVKSIKKDFSDTRESGKSIKKDTSDTEEEVKTIKEDVSYIKQVMPSQEETEKAAEKGYVEMLCNDDFYKRVLNRSQTFLIEHLDPNAVLDFSLSEEYLDRIQVRDIRDLQIKSERTRAIVEKVKSKGVKGYKDFKRILLKTGHKHIADHLQEKERKKQQWDMHQWRDCLQMTDKAMQIERARTLLNMNILPGQAEVHHALSVFEKSSETFISICRSISDYVRTKSSEVIEVWAAYKCDEFVANREYKLVFVAITKTGNAGVSDNNYEIFERGQDDFSGESGKVLKEVENGLPEENIFSKSALSLLKKTVLENADYLMENHRNINVVSPSVKKSKNFGRKDAVIYDQLCIALYVHIKGLVPIKEEPFYSEIGGFPTDVLEDGFCLFSGGPNDYHDKLKMGLAIHANVPAGSDSVLWGTLGGFLNYPSGCICALTCAHVVCSNEEMNQLKERKKIDFSDRNKEVFQPVSPDSKAFGRVLSTFYSEGGHDSSGMEVALVKIEDRFPECGSFPAAPNYADAGFDESNPMVYDTGKVRPMQDIPPQVEVYKYGISTGVTRGSLSYGGSVVRTRPLDLPFDIRLYNQIEVLRINDKIFAKPGDSGALVFFDNRDGDSEAIGIVEGALKSGKILVTPIYEILRNIGGPLSLKRFRPDDVHDDDFEDMDTST